MYNNKTGVCNCHTLENLFVALQLHSLYPQTLQFFNCKID